MNFQYLKTEAEGAALFASGICYLILISVVMLRYVKLLRNKHLTDEICRAKQRTLSYRAIMGLCICALFHVVFFAIFFKLMPEKSYLSQPPRNDYYWSILVTFFFFSLVMWFGFFLKGSSTLPKQEGPTSGV